MLYFGDCAYYWPNTIDLIFVPLEFAKLALPLSDDTGLKEEQPRVIFVSASVL
jgi:hypothetical protein